jgi:hypothetical protein
MMIVPRKDAIFWWASGIFVTALVVAAITRNDLWLFLMVASYLLRPTLASFGIARRFVDERQMSIQYRSGNIAFAVMLAAAIVLAVMQRIKGDPSWEFFNIVIVLGLASKALFNVLLVKNYREAGSRIIMAVGGLVVLFVAAENGPTLAGLAEASPGLAIVLIGWLARRYPRTIGTLIFVVTLGLLIVILGKGFTIGQITTALVVCVPLSLAGASLFARDGIDVETSAGHAANTKP